MRVLLVKMSSLGDVVHALPAVTDATRMGIEIDWVVEEAFTAIPAAHPGVSRVLPIAWRRWRRTLGRSRGELVDFFRNLRAERYDLILDAQGLIKSAMVTAVARGGGRAGFNFTTVREPVAALAYDRRLAIPTTGHAIDRLRALFAGALGYPAPEAAPDFGLPGAGTVRGDECLFLHGTTWASKHWPEAMWRALAEDLIRGGWRVGLPWGDETERARAERIAAGLSGARVLGSLSLAELADSIARAGLVVGVDSGLAHLAAALGRPSVLLYGSTSAEKTGARGARVINLQSTLSCSPCLARRCRYREGTLEWQDVAVEPPCYALLPPDTVREEAIRLLEH